MLQTNNKVSVLLPLVFRKTFDYRVPENMQVGVGDYVRVPFGGKQVWGVVWGSAGGGIEESRIKEISAVAAHLPVMSEATRKFIDWVAWYTLAPAGQVLKMAIPLPDALEAPVPDYKLRIAEGAEKLRLTPSRLRIISYLSDNIPRSRKEIEEHAGVSANVVREFLKVGGLKEVAETTGLSSSSRLPVAIHPLSPAQAAAAASLRDKLGKGFSVSLLDGVTGSGKTEVYFDVIAECIQKGQQALVLLPEIALSVQWLARFEKRFGFAPDVWRSSVSHARKRKTWQGVVEGSTKVVVGARSALFLPYKNLASIVVDEEHDASYKQEEGVIYHARDMAIVRATQEKIPTVLVSATPSLETEFNVQQGRFARVHLPERHNEAELPKTHLIDMRQFSLPSGKWISEPLKDALIHTLAAKKQAMIFMNRRGYAPLMLCRACGHRLECPNCTSWLVLHRTKNKLLCHHCGYITAPPKVCPECTHENSLIPYGPGVERIAEELQELFPKARIKVMASDSVELKGQNNIIEAMLNHEIDILVGTQMIAKGHHFAGLALVGVIDADMGLMGGDLRAGERTYQLLHQLSGRAGREKTKGEVYLQTYMPEHPVMKALAAGDRDKFMLLEARMREDAAMPPYGKLAAVVIEGKNEQQVAIQARDLVKSANEILHARIRGGGKADDLAGEVSRSETGGSVPPSILGPAPAPLTRLKNKYRYRILIKAGRSFHMQQFLNNWLHTKKIPSSLKLKVDVEPYSFV
jgi:primosomal protein N' (replication factor Y)